METTTVDRLLLAYHIDSIDTIGHSIAIVSCDLIAPQSLLHGSGIDLAHRLLSIAVTEWTQAGSYDCYEN